VNIKVYQPQYTNLNNNCYRIFNKLIEHVRDNKWRSEIHTLQNKSNDIKLTNKNNLSTLLKSIIKIVLQK